MIQRQLGFKEMPALCQIVVGFTLFWVPFALATAIRRREGLDGLVMAGWCSLGLSVLSMASLFAFSSSVREVCRTAPRELTTKTSQGWILALVITNVVMAGVIFSLHKTQLAPAAVGLDVGWSHYFSLPPDRRPDFLLHYLCLRDVDSIVTGPIAEELFHIGVLVGVLRKYNFPWPWIFALDAPLFVILHQSHGGGFIGVTRMLHYGVGRLFLDYTFYKTGNIAVPIGAHMLNNLRVMSFNWFPLLP